jgi:hypothetical protein
MDDDEAVVGMLDNRLYRELSGESVYVRWTGYAQSRMARLEGRRMLKLASRSTAT